MSILEQSLDSIFCKHTIKKILKIHWGFEPPNLPFGYASETDNHNALFIRKT